MEPIQGGCQCGAVRYELSDDPITTAMCFCSDCQVQSGSAFGLSLIVPKNGFRVVQGEPGSFTRSTYSGSTTDCAFCRDCGTRLFHSPKRMPETVNVKPGTLDDPSWVQPKLAVWTIRKPTWFAIPEGIHQFERNPERRPAAPAIPRD